VHDSQRTSVAAKSRLPLKFTVMMFDAAVMLLADATAAPAAVFVFDVVPVTSVNVAIQFEMLRPAGTFLKMKFTWVEDDGEAGNTAPPLYCAADCHISGKFSATLTVKLPLIAAPAEFSSAGPPAPAGRVVLAVTADGIVVARVGSTRGGVTAEMTGMTVLVRLTEPDVSDIVASISPDFPLVPSNTPAMSNVETEPEGKVIPVVGFVGGGTTELVAAGVPSPMTMLPPLLLTEEIPTLAPAGPAGDAPGPAGIKAPVPFITRIPAAVLGKPCVLVIGTPKLIVNTTTPGVDAAPGLTHQTRIVCPPGVSGIRVGPAAGISVCPVLAACALEPRRATPPSTATLVTGIAVPPAAGGAGIAANGPILAVVAVSVKPHVTVDCAYTMLPMVNMMPNVSTGISSRLNVICFLSLN